MKETTASNNDVQPREHAPICPMCGRPVETIDDAPVNYCNRCGTPITSEAVRERIVTLMLQGIRPDMEKVVARLEREEPETYNGLAAIITGKAA